MLFFCSGFHTERVNMIKYIWQNPYQVSLNSVLDVSKMTVSCLLNCHLGDKNKHI